MAKVLVKKGNCKNVGMNDFMAIEYFFHYFSILIILKYINIEGPIIEKGVH